MVFSNILVPVDGSEHSDRAVSYANEIALKFNSKLTLLHVYSFTPPILTSTVPAPTYNVMSPETISLMSQKVRKDAKRILMEAKKNVKAKDVVVKSILSEGGVVNEILKIVEAENVDLIVMGASGIGGIKKLVLGSVSEAVAHKVSCPVLITR